MKDFACRCLVVSSLLAIPAVAIDRIVDRNNPSAYPTLQAALDAANPGDRVLLRTTDLGPPSGNNRVTKSVTIRGEGGGIVTIGRPALEIVALTPGIPLILESLALFADSTGGNPTAVVMTTRGARLAGEVVFDGVEVTGDPSLYFLRATVDVAVERLTLRRSLLRMRDTLNNNACCEELYNHGGDALRFSGRDLLLEDATLIAGSANRLAYSAGCFGLCPNGGLGGAALIADARLVTMVRSALSDGNGGSVDASSLWPRQPTAGSPGTSQLVGAGGLLSAYATTLQSGVPDRGGPTLPRGAISLVGSPWAPLSAGSARLGQSLTLTVALDATTDPVALLLGVGRDALATPLGVLHIPSSALVAVLPFPTPGQLSLSVPNNSALVGAAVVAQHAYALRATPRDLRLGNPTATWLRQ